MKCKACFAKGVSKRNCRVCGVCVGGDSLARGSGFTNLVNNAGDRDYSVLGVGLSKGVSVPTSVARGARIKSFVNGTGTLKGVIGYRDSIRVGVVKTPKCINNMLTFVGGTGMGGYSCSNGVVVAASKGIAGNINNVLKYAGSDAANVRTVVGKYCFSNDVGGGNSKAPGCMTKVGSCSGLSGTTRAVAGGCIVNAVSYATAGRKAVCKGGGAMGFSYRGGCCCTNCALANGNKVPVSVGGFRSKRTACLLGNSRVRFLFKRRLSSSGGVPIICDNAGEICGAIFVCGNGRCTMLCGGARVGFPRGPIPSSKAAFKK